MIINDKRALAYTAKIEEVKEIPGYDLVEHARVGAGWWCIVSKADDFKPGDLCVYFEVDSKVPANDERFAFMEKRNYKVKTLRMCKVYSQGLIMPVTAFPEITTTEEHIDVTDVLHITYAVEEDNARKNGDPNAKYTSMKARHKKLFKHPLVKKIMRYAWGRKLMFFFFGKKKDNPRTFPTPFQFIFIHKTDEERCENLPWVLGYKDPLIVTEKLDGTSSTYILEKKGRNKYEFYVLSRNVRQQDENQKTYHDHNIYWDMAFKYDIENKLKQYLDENGLDYVCIQGESVGSVQGNPLQLTEDDLYVFNFIRSDKGRIPSNEGKLIVEEMGMKWVPILDLAFQMPDDMESFKVMADGKSVVNPKVDREGIVLRDPKTDFSFKNVSRKYLLKHGG